MRLNVLSDIILCVGRPDFNDSVIASFFSKWKVGDTFLDYRPSMTRTVYKLAKICDWLSLIKDDAFQWSVKWD